MREACTCATVLAPARASHVPQSAYACTCRPLGRMPGAAVEHSDPRTCRSIVRPCCARACRAVKLHELGMRSTVPVAS